MAARQGVGRRGPSRAARPRQRARVHHGDDAARPARDQDRGGRRQDARAVRLSSGAPPRVGAARAAARLRARRVRWPGPLARAPPRRGRVADPRGAARDRAQDIRGGQAGEEEVIDAAHLAKAWLATLAMMAAQGTLLALAALAVTRAGRLRPGWQAAV